LQRKFIKLFELSLFFANFLDSSELFH
jgi:hypothetical protein